MLCLNCGGQIAGDVKFCPLCGKPIEVPKTVNQFCSNCGTKVAPNAAFCIKCGKKINEIRSQNKFGSFGIFKKEMRTTAESQEQKPISSTASPQTDGGEQEIDLAEIWYTLLSIVLKIPDLKIDRDVFLREKLTHLCYKNEVEAAIAGNPAETINPQIIAKVANKCIDEKQNKISSSFILKLANFAINKTAIGSVLEVLECFGIKVVPVDFVVYYYLEVKLLQEIAYLYGFSAMFDDSGKPLANTVDILTICIAVTADEITAKDKLEKYLGKNELASKYEDVKLDLNVLKRILPSLIMVSKDDFTYNTKILQNFLHRMYFGEIPEKSTLKTKTDLSQGMPFAQFCPGCGAKITASGIRFCEKCGTSLVLDNRKKDDLEEQQNLITTMPIQNNYMDGYPPISNNAPIENQINVLPSATDMVVGSVLADAVYNEELKSANTAAILCLCLGWYGAHDFYCSKIHNAIIKLILGLTGVGLIATVPWALMDLWSIWKGEYVDGNGQKLGGKATILWALFILIIAVVAFCAFFRLIYQQEMM